MHKVAFLYSDRFWESGHGPAHPMKPERLKRTFELLSAYEVFDEVDSLLVEPRPATKEELCAFHSPEYVDAVRLLTEGREVRGYWRYGFGPGDNPVFPLMYETEALKAGASLIGAEMLIAGDVNAAFNPGGGLHHAKSAQASGFCVFNDPVIAIHRMVREGWRVVYIDIDAHHGDGVQEAFYDSDQVLTISLHESGQYLFPGTGFVNEQGTGRGQGYSVNIPLPPYTADEDYLRAFREVVLPLVRRFTPDAIVSQLGIDTHYRDPLTHLALTTVGFTAVVGEIRDLATRWLALGGGGYDIDMVPRAWTLAYGLMIGRELADPLPSSYVAEYGGETLRDHAQPETAGSAGWATTQVESVISQVKDAFEL